jgi:tetratricopeptide (TPR) repeat protein
MEKPAKQSRTRSSFTEAPGRWWKNVIVPAVPVLACFLGGATEKWSEGIIVALLGLILLVDPPRGSLGLVLNLILLGLLGFAATAFLPERWFFQPAWRIALVNDFGLKLPGSLSAQPWITLGCFLSFLAGLSWLYYMSTVELELRDVRQQLRFFTGGIILLAALCVILHAANTTLPFWHNFRGFGPFPNRNQTANLFGLTAIILLACAQDDIRHGRKRWIAWLFGLGIIIAAIILNFSRAGILLLVAGSALWLGVFALRKGSTTRIGVGVSVILILLTVMLLFGGQTFERFHLRAGDSGGASPELRLAIFRDTLQLIRASPWCGIGLGNFDEVFAIFRDASLTGSRSLHPESDWLWLWSEAGWPALVLTIAALVLLLRRVFPLQEGTNQRFRVAALIAAVLFALHGVVDVSGHRVGTIFAGIFLLGLALRRPMQLRSSFATALTFRFVGILLLAAGTTWAIATRYEMPLAGSVGVANEKRLASVANQGGNFSETIERTTRALQWAPLSWQLYFLRALGEVGAKLPAAAAIDDFRRARFLEPNAYEVPFEEGQAWLVRNPLLTITAWREALRRVQLQRLEIYGHMLALSRQFSPKVHRGLEELGMAQHDLALSYFERASGEEFARALHLFLEHDPTLETFSNAEKIKFFQFWAERGDADELMRTVATHPEWMPFAWGEIAKYHAKKNDFRAAVGLVQQYAERPRLPQTAAGSSIDQLRQALHANPDSYAIGYQLFHEQMEEGKIDEALVTARHFTEQPNCPGYFYFLETEACAGKENWEPAWRAWEKFQKAGQIAGK